MVYEPHMGQHFDTQHPGVSDQSLVWTKLKVCLRYYIKI